MQKKSIFFNQKGATAVECAIVLSLLLTLIFGMLEFSLAMFNRQVITNAAREGARAGIVARPVRLSDNEIETVALGYCTQHLVTFGGGQPTVGIGPVGRCLQFQCDLEVTVNYEYEFLFLFDIEIWPIDIELGSIDLQATSVMKME